MTEIISWHIDRDVPIPPKPGRKLKSAWRAWPFADMQVGDSVFFGGLLLSMAARTASQDYAARERTAKFTTRAFDKDPITKLPGVRVWRIK